MEAILLSIMSDGAITWQPTVYSKTNRTRERCFSVNAADGSEEKNVRNRNRSGTNALLVTSLGAAFCL